MAVKQVGAAPSGSTDAATKGYVDTTFAALTSSSMNAATATGTGASLGTSEALLGSVSLTVGSSSSKILVLAFVSLTKDTGTTVRTATLKTRRGATTGSTQVGQNALATSTAVASSAYYAQDSLGGLDSPATTGSVTYGVFGLVGAGASTAAWTILAIELTGAVGPQGPAGTTLVSENPQTAAYTLALTDGGNAVAVSVSSGVNITVPPNSSVAFPVGTIIEVTQMGTAQLTILAGSGVTIVSADSLVKTRVQYSAVSLRKRATDVWVLAGDLA